MTKQDIIERAKRVSFSSNPKDYIDFVGELAKENESVPSDVQEDKAAMDYYLNLPNSSYGEGGNLLPRSINDAFKAGAEWQRKKPIPEDVQEAANQYIGYPPEVDEGVSMSQRRQAFADGMLAERWRVNRKAEVPEGYDPKYDKEALEAADEYVKGVLTYGAFSLMRPAFADGWMANKARLMKEAVDGEVVSDLKNVNNVRTMSKIPDTLYFGEKVSVIIIKKEK